MNRFLKKLGKKAICIPKERTFQKEGTISRKPLNKEHAWHVWETAKAEGKSLLAQMLVGKHTVPSDTTDSSMSNDVHSPPRMGSRRGTGCDGRRMQAP